MCPLSLSSLAAPSAEPRNVQLTPKSSTQLEITWEAPSLAHWNSEYLSYKVGYKYVRFHNCIIPPQEIQFSPWHPRCVNSSLPCWLYLHVNFSPESLHENARKRNEIKWLPFPFAEIFVVCLQTLNLNHGPMKFLSLEIRDNKKPKIQLL